MLHEGECSASLVDPFVVRHAEQHRPRAGAAHALPAEEQQISAPSSRPAAPRLIVPHAACTPVDPSCIAEPSERLGETAACMPAACMSGVEGMRSIAADDRLRRQAIAEAARSKLEAVNRQQERLAARRAALDDRSSIPFVGTYEDNIMCMLPIHETCVSGSNATGRIIRSQG